MSRPRIKLAQLLAFVLLAGALMGALKSPSPLVASATFTALAALLLAATVAALRSREPARTSYLGFAIFGWGFGLLTFAPGAENGLAGHLLSTHLINAHAPGAPANYALELTGMPYTLNNVNGTIAMKGSDAVATSVFGYSSPAQVGTNANTTLAFTLASAGPDPSFVRVAQVAAVVVFALAGGIFARLFLSPAALPNEEHAKAEHGGTPA